jgi:hypothetical protein
MKKKEAKSEPKPKIERKLPQVSAWEARPFKPYEKDHSPAVKKGNSVIARGGSAQKAGFTRIQPSEGSFGPGELKKK